MLQYSVDKPSTYLKRIWYDTVVYEQDALELCVITSYSIHYTKLYELAIDNGRIHVLETRDDVRRERPETRRDATALFGARDLREDLDRLV